MLIINYQRLNYAEAIADEKHPMYAYAKEYGEGLNELRRKYPEGFVRFVRKGYPKFSDGYLDATGVERAGVPEPIPPMRLSLRANVSHPTRGKEQWAVCLGAPFALPGGLWDIGGKLDSKTKQITNGITVDLINEPDFAFFLAYKSPQVKGGHLVIDDPKADVKAKGNIEREQLDRKIAIWQTLTDDEQLRKVASAYGISDVGKKEPDAIRFDLEEVLKKNDELKKRDPSYKGTKEFLEDLKITDYVRLSAFIRHWMDESQIVWHKDGRYKVGDKMIAHVPAESVPKKFAWLCNYFAAPNNKDRLQELFRDLINKDYLDSLTDPKDFRWIAGVMNIEGYYNKPPEQVKTLVYSEFNIV